MSNESTITIPEEVITSKIYLIRDKKVMLDSDLAELYEVETKQLKRAVRRNIKRFPEDFMFELTKKEFSLLRSQFGTSNWGGTRCTGLLRKRIKSRNQRLRKPNG